MKDIKKYLKGLSLRTDEHYVKMIIGVCGVIFVWRGVWNIVDTYLFPEHPMISNMASIVIGLALLYLLDNDFDRLQ